MAIHDAVYATPPATWEQFRYRLTYIAEERIGVPLRAAARHEDAAFDALNNAG